jgi:hypothetical protein
MLDKIKHETFTLKETREQILTATEEGRCSPNEIIYIDLEIDHKRRQILLLRWMLGENNTE